MKFLAFSFLFIFCLSGCSTSTKQSSAKKFPFYKISKDQKTVGYLLGTIHYGVNYPVLPDVIKNAAHDADIIVIETNLLSAQTFMLKSFPAGEKDSLKKLLTDEQWNVLYGAVAPLLGPNIHLLDRMHPTMAFLTYTITLLPNTTNPIDLVLQHNAKLNDQKLMYLETPESQIDVLLKTQNIDQLRLALSTSKKEAMAEIDTLLAAYKSNDLHTMDRMLEKQLKPEDQKIIITDRNQAWVEILKDDILTADGIKFIAVGAGHLGGETGLLNQLKKMDYKVTFEKQDSL